MVCEPVAQSSEATIVIDGVTAAAAVGPDFGVTLRDADTSGVPPPDGTELDVDAIGIRVTGLADGSYEVSYTTGSAANARGGTASVSGGGALRVQMPAQGVVTIAAQ